MACAAFFPMEALRPEEMTVAVFGPGLLGGSLLLEARRLGFGRLRAWARREESVRELLSGGYADEASVSVAEVARGADLVVLCTPVEAMAGLAGEMVSVLAGSRAVVTDVGSVKGKVMEEVGPVLAAGGVPFVGSHPMAGSEKGGLGAARLGLYGGAACIVTPGGAGEAAVRLVRGFWELMGCVVTEMEAGEHDRTVARISHLPHVAAVVATLAALRGDPGAGRYAAGGLRDTTRVAGGDPAMWRGILLGNAEAVVPALRDLVAETTRLMEMVEAGDGSGLESMLREAKALRRTRYPD